ncbi:MAG: hypothetical protein LH609_10470 [Rudanella sp.]|nr:hypothetical protein [Rudanella sp.]
MPFRDSILTTDLILLAISAGLFGVYAFVLRAKLAASDMMLFFLHYAVIYAILLMSNDLWKFKNHRRLVNGPHAARHRDQPVFCRLESEPRMRRNRAQRGRVAPNRRPAQLGADGPAN